MSSLSAIRAKLAASENRGKSTQTQSNKDTSIYPFWDIKDGEQAQIRFLQDGDASNSFFWVERNMIKLPFTGVKGQNDQKEYLVQVPCVEMYGDNCPVLAEVRTWYKDESLKQMANKYWKKRTYLFQGFVKSSPLQEEKETVPENPIRRFVITPQIFGVINTSLLNPEIEEMPTDQNRGLNFNIIKTSKGGYADYSTSGFARRETALNEAELAAIEQYGLYDLKSFLPKKPSESELRIIKEMFEASVDGRPYDAERWGAYFKPWGLETGNSTRREDDNSVGTAVPAARVSPMAKPAPVAESTQPWEDDVTTAEASFAKEPVVVASAPAASSDRANDILAMIRSRQKTA